MKSSPAASDRAVLKALTATDSTGVDGDEILRLVQRLFLSTKNGDEPRQVVFCGVGPENSSGSLCAHAARLLAVHSLRSVCVVYANPSSSNLAARLGGDTSIANRLKPVSVPDHCLKVGENLTFAGPELLADGTGGLALTGTLKQIFTQLRTMFDFVLIDSPAADLSEYAAILGQLSDGAVLVVDAEVTRKITARKAKEALETANVHLFGAVLNDRCFPVPQWLYDRL